MEAFLQHLLLELAVIGLSVALMRLVEWITQQIRHRHSVEELVAA